MNMSDLSSSKCDGNFWKFNDMKKLTEMIFRQYGIDKLHLTSAYTIKLAADGAPTTKHIGLVTLSLVICDPRTNDEIRKKPQSKKNCFPIAGYFGKESYEEMTEAFADILAEFLAMGTIAGVPIDVCYGVDLSADGARPGSQASQKVCAAWALLPTSLQSSHSPPGALT